MKILQTPIRFHPYIGGVEKYVLDLSAELVKLGHKITVICANEPLCKEEEKFNGIKVKRLRYVGKLANTNISLALPFKILNEDFDILHTHFPSPWSADWSAVISIIKRKPLVVTYHNDIDNHPTFGFLAKVYSHFFLRFVLKNSEKIIITQPDYLKYSNFLKKYESKVITIPNCVDTKRFKALNCKKNKNTISFLSCLDSFHRYKGLDYLIKALWLVKKKIPNIRLIVGGKGKLIEEYKELAKKLDLEKNIEFLGYVANTNLVRLYNQSQIFVLPSISHDEGFGIVLLEAMACKTPVICTYLAGVAKDVKENNAGIVIRPKDIRSLGNAIIKILTNKKLSEKMQKNALLLVRKRYDSKKVARKAERAYKEIIKNESKAHSTKSY